MAIRFGMTVNEMIRQLTNGFRSVKGRNPDGLELIKIQQEAVQRFKDMNKVVDMQGNPIDVSKGIMGGRQIQQSPEFGEKVRRIYDRAKGPGKGQEMVDALGSPGARKSYEIMEAQLGVRLYGDETFDEILEIQRTGKHPRGEPRAGKGKFTKAEYLIQRLKNTIKANPDDEYVQKNFPNMIKELEADPDLAKNENVFRELGGDLPSDQKIKVYDDDTLDFFTKKDPDKKAEGGRIGYKTGSIDRARRAFLKTMGAVGAGIGAIKTGILGIGKGGAKQAVKQVVTPPIKGKQVWFDAVVNRVLREGEDVTKGFATKEREEVYRMDIGNKPITGDKNTFQDNVYVYRSLDTGEIRIEYNSVDNMGEAPVDLVYKPGIADEASQPADQFFATESVPEGRAVGPDDFDIEDVENMTDNIADLNSDVSKLRLFATGDKGTTKEILESIQKRKRARNITENKDGAQSDFITERQGDYDPGDDFASGGIARLLGE